MKKTIVLGAVLLGVWYALWFGVMKPSMEVQYLADGGTFDGFTMLSVIVNIGSGAIIGFIAAGTSIVRD